MANPTDTFDQIMEKQLPLAQLLTRFHFEQKPELEARYGKAGREKSIQDSIYHLLYLAESIRVGNAGIFNSYVEWASHVLQSRNVPNEVLIDNLNCMEKGCKELLPFEDYQLIQGYITGGISRLKNINPLPETYLVENNPLHSFAKQYLSLLLKGKRNDAQALILDLINSKETLPVIYEHIFQATQYEVGLLWQTNKITVAHEHYCTAATQLIMAGLYPYIFETKKNGAKLVACSIGGDFHEMGIRMVSDLFEMDGWDTYYMGSNMPDSNILTALTEQQPDILAVSVTMPFHISRAESLIKKIRGDKKLAKLKIIAGGYAFAIPGLWQQTGADGYAPNAQAAIALANKLISKL